MTITIKQGDSCGIFLNLKQNDQPLLPSMVDDLEVYIGETLRLTAVEGTVKFDTSSSRWFIWPTQEQTFALEEGAHKVEIRAKYKSGVRESVKGYDLPDKIKVRASQSRNVL